MSLKINSIVKQYGRKLILDNLSIEVDKGVNYTLLGKNGAGKTTLINIISDFVKADMGRVEFNAMNYQNNAFEIKRNIGIVSEGNFLINELTGNEYLNFVGKLYNIPNQELKMKMESLTKFFFSEADDLKKVISKYSTGMKKKLELCASVLHTPQFLILDEPFSGLDPVAANQLISFLNKYQNGNRIIFLSSHNLNYIEKIATHIGVLNDSKIIFDGTLNEFTQNGKDLITDSLLEKLGETSSNIEEIEWLS